MVNDLSGIDDLELMPLGGGYMVRRERLMNELIAKGRKAGIVVLYAPTGLGRPRCYCSMLKRLKAIRREAPCESSRQTAPLGARCLCSSRSLPKSLRTNRTP